MIEIRIPPPPSVNAMYRAVKGRSIKSEAYRNWITAAGWEVMAQRPGTVSGPYELCLVLPQSMRGDIDNRLKPVLDLMVSLGITPDDRHAQRVTVCRDIDPSADTACILIRGAA